MSKQASNQKSVGGYKTIKDECVGSLENERNFQENINNPALELLTKPEKRSESSELRARAPSLITSARGEDKSICFVGEFIYSPQIASEFRYGRWSLRGCFHCRAAMAWGEEGLQGVGIVWESTGEKWTLDGGQ
ncbi:hypothetical protein JTE90_019853 [Oedothorax gibbosus]|uniref:Uncharacterized protein n=1 Tax=Oedothorax gibbosus TaxID=931172 RepID=A0AAV6VX62_9ARAC|nr:hypothetical protein JTE90_019853 [Oedothorax gibbosus]